MLRPKANVPPNTTQNLMRTFPWFYRLEFLILNLIFTGNSAQTIGKIQKPWSEEPAECCPRYRQQPKGTTKGRDFRVRSSNDLIFIGTKKTLFVLGILL